MPNCIIKTRYLTDVSALLRSNGVVVKKRYKNLPRLLLVDLTASQMQSLGSSPQIESITPESSVSLIPEPIPASVGRSLVGFSPSNTNFYDDVWGVRYIKAPEVHRTKGNLGAGVRVVIMDTGGDSDHPGLKITGGQNFIDGGSWEDDNGHGTHVNGIIAAQFGDAHGVTGVAPDAEIYHYKILSGNGTGSSLDIIEAVDATIDLAEGGTIPVVVNQSFGSSSDLGPAFEEAYIIAGSSGIIFISAAGNSGLAGNNVMYPAKYDTNVAVVSIDESGQKSSFSSFGPESEVAAPGGSIMSTTFDGAYGIKSGTSMACPHIVGAFALALASGIKDPRSAIKGSTDRDEWSPEFGEGVIDCVKFVSDRSSIPVFGNRITIDASESTDDKAVLTYDFMSGRTGGSWIRNGTPFITFNYPEDGIYDTALRVWDGEFLDILVQTIEIRTSPSANKPPVARYTIKDDPL